MVYEAASQQIYDRCTERGGARVGKKGTGQTGGVNPKDHIPHLKV